TQTGSALQEGQSAIPGQSRRLRVVCLGAIRLDKPMSRASITMERDAAVRTLQSLFQFVDVCFRFELVVLGEVAEIRCLRVVECIDAGAVEHDDRTNPFGIGGGKVQRIMGTERETNYGQTAIRFFGATPEKCYRVSDFGLGLEMIGVECFG